MKRDHYIDYLRAAATFAVIIWHSVSPVYYLFGPPAEWLPANILFGPAIRWSVVSFIMISGALLLDKDEPPAVFYKKRLLRICIPLLTWTVIYGLMRLYYFKTYTYTNQPKPSTFLFIASQFRDLFFNNLSYHLYFISLILGLYAITPFLGRMVRALTQKEMLIFMVLGVGLCSLRGFFPSLIVADRFGLSAYTVYFLLGYYLHKYPPAKKQRLLIYIAGAAAAILMTWMNYNTEYLHKGHRDTYYSSEGMFTYAITIALFVFFRQHINGAGNRLPGKLAKFISSNSYGIYIAHPLVIGVLLYGSFKHFTFSTALSTTVLFGYKVSIIMNNAWGAVVQAMIVTIALMAFFYLIGKLRLQRYFT
ncbi:MAG TPA: acyltransferase [Puia sp.]|jgi:surface polysaccharide O-acyltransferase-like enzyme|nr:acyltransferase [Puia sp.]